MDDKNVTATQKLLRSVFNNEKFATDDYLRWLYLNNPSGKAITIDINDDEGLLGHLAVVPTLFSNETNTSKIGLAIHVAVHKRGRKLGLFRKMAPEIAEKCKELDFGAIIGLANRLATPGWKKSDYEVIAPLPVCLLSALPFWSPDTTNHPVTDEFLTSPAFGDLLGRIDFTGRSGWEPTWSPEKLRWRLIAPGATYTLHIGPSGAFISTASKVKGMTVAIILKTFPFLNSPSKNATHLLRAIAKFHKTPFLIYGGTNRNFKISGINIPRKYRPSPLNFIYKKLSDSPVFKSPLELATFEFLDFDAY